MPDFILDAGFGIWPVLLLGLVTLALGVRHATDPRPERMPLIVGLGITTLLFGLLGTALGVQASARYIEDLSDAGRWVFVVGLRESLNNLVAGLALVIPAALATTIGSHRGPGAVARRGHFADAPR